MPPVQARDVISAIEGPTSSAGSAFYFHPDTVARGKELGLDGFRFYFLGRGGVLGDVPAEVVVSAFGYFEPNLLAKMWNSGRERVSPPDAAREHLACNAALARARLAELPGLDAYADAAAKVVASVDLGGLPLFAGVRAQPVPTDVPARALHHAVLLRELRGSVHLAAVVACGLRTEVAHAIQRPGDVAMFGWSEPPAVSDEHRAAHERARALTDDLLVPAFEVLDETERVALIDGARAIHAALSAG
jgi:hypothetical protein